jgi:hypothetical protein
MRRETRPAFTSPTGPILQVKMSPTARRARRLAAFLILGGVFLMSHQGRGIAAEALTLACKIPLGAVEGRIDHLSIDLARQHLFLVELGSGSLGVVDLQRGKLLDRIEGLKESRASAALLQTLPPSAGMVPGREREPGHVGLQGAPLRR